ncbi:MAG: TonB-dependent receptor domain-containing protein [Prolixibacteraceae bacterium]
MVRGQVIDQSTNLPISYASVIIYSVADSSTVGGAITNAAGNYQIENLKAGEYISKVSFLGYNASSTNNFEITGQSQIVNLGQVMLLPGNENIDEVQVIAEKATYNNSIDRKVYNVEKDVLSQSGSVSDLLQNIPSVLVDVDGNVSLRGSENVLIMINGKPSILMGANRAAVLQQLPANTIEKIEVMTNPSAKFKPDGTSGIINIVLKKNREQGFNGSVGGNIGNQNRINGTLSANYNTGKFNFFGTYGIRQDDRPRSSTDMRIMTDTITNEKSYFEQEVSEYSRPLSQIARIGIDYSINENNSLGIATDYNHKNFIRKDTSMNTWLDENHLATKEFTRTRIDNEYENENEFTAYFHHQFQQEDHELNIEYTQQNQFEEEDNHFTEDHTIPNVYRSLDNTLIRQKEKQSLVYVEYAYAVNEQSKLEAGYVGEFAKIDLDFGGELYDINGQKWITDVEKTSRFLYDQAVHALYTTYGYTFGAFSMMGGLRMEQSNINSHLYLSDSIISSSYFRLYPSLHMAYEIDDNSEWQLNYSHRINRPEADNLNPYAEYRDPLNIRVGNPYLKPEDIHSIELGYEWKNDQFSIIPTVYYRYKYNEFTRITEFMNDSVLVTSYQNLSSSQSSGVELIMSYKPSNFASINMSTNGYYQTIDASNLGLGASKSAFSWNATLAANINLSKNTLIQLNTYYRSASITPQGKYNSRYQMNLGFRQDLFNKKASVILTVSDVFNSLRSNSVLDTPWMYQETSRKRDSRSIYLGFVYHFGHTSKKQKDGGLEFDNAL